MSAASRFDRWLFAPGWAERLAWLRLGLGTVILLRVTLWPYVELAGTPPGLFRPPWFLSWTGGMPSAGVIVALQTAGAAGAAIAVAGSWKGWRSAAAGLGIAWLALLALAGFKTSTGKILHNDVLLLLVAVPVVLCGTRARVGDRSIGVAYGWPLRAGLVVTAIVYATCGIQKLRHSGPAWVFSDNMGWILDGAVRGGRAPTTVIASAIASSPVASVMAAAALLGLELVFPVVLLSRRARLPVAGAAVALHAMTWLTLGLDYWAWALVVAVVVGLSGLPDPGPATAPRFGRASASPTG